MKKGKKSKKVCPSDEIPTKPDSSPYTKAPIEIHVGEEPTVYYIPSHFLPCGSIAPNGEDPIVLNDVDVKTVHTLVHYLYTNQYEMPSTSNELEETLQVYIMARKYKISGLAELASHEVQRLCEELDIFQIMKPIEPVFTKLRSEGSLVSPVDAILREKVTAMFQVDHTAFYSDAFLAHLDNAEFRSFMLGCVMKLYIDQVTLMKKREQQIDKAVEETEDASQTSDTSKNSKMEQQAIQETSLAAVECEKEPVVRHYREEVVLEPMTMPSEDLAPPEEVQPNDVCYEEQEEKFDHDPEYVYPLDPYADKPVNETASENDSVWDFAPIPEKKPKKGRKDKTVLAEAMESPDVDENPSLPDFVEIARAPEPVFRDICPNQWSHIHAGGKRLKSCTRCRKLVASIRRQTTKAELEVL